MRWVLSIPGELILRAGVWLDPGITPCVKTHTIAKCRKYNSPTRYRTSCAQHDSTPWCAISSRCFYVRGGRWSFRTDPQRSSAARFAVMHNRRARTEFLLDYLVGAQEERLAPLLSVLKPRFAGLLFSIPPISHHHSRAPAGAVIGDNPKEKRARERAKVRRLET
jgi:hypothetical protein